MFAVSKILRGLISPKYRTKLLVSGFVNRLPKLNGNFHTNSQLCVKMFMELENRFAYQLMETKGYALSFDVEQDDIKMTKEQFEQLMKEDWSKLKEKQLFDTLPVLGTYCRDNGLCISNKMFDDYIDCLTDNIKYASDEELKTLFYSLAKWPETESIRTRNYIEVWAALDDACLNRMNSWSYDEILKFVSLFFMLNVTKNSDFTQKSINKLATKAKQLTRAQLVQEFFYVGVLRRQPFDMHNLEVQMINCFDDLTIDDIAILAMGLFKSKTPIRSMDLVSKIINLVVENKADIHEVSLAAILKVVRYSVRINTDDKIYRLLDALQHEVDRLSVMCIVHLALLGTTTLTLHKGCLTKIAEKMNNSLSNARIKDLERLALTFGTFNYVPTLATNDCFFEKIANELRKPEREAEVNRHGRSFACCVGYLGLLGKYPVDLMNKVLSPEFLENTYGKQCHGYGREILIVHNTAIIFCPGDIKNRLTDREATIMAKRYTDFVPNAEFKKQYNITERMFLDIFQTLSEERGSRFVKGDHILTHHQRGDVIVCNNHEGVPMPVTEKLDKKFGVIVRPPDDNNWIALVIAGRNAIINGTNTPSGPFQAKIRELKALGYHGVLVPWSGYNTKKTKEDLCYYLNDLIKSAVK